MKNNAQQEGYVIKHTNMLPMLLPFIVLGMGVCAVIGVCQFSNLISLDTTKDYIYLFITYAILLGDVIGLFIYGMYTMKWELQIVEETIFHTNWLGRRKRYSFSDITRCIDSKDSFYVYSGKKRIFQLGKYEKNWFWSEIKRRNIPIETKQRMSLEKHTVRAPRGIPGFEMIASVFFFSIGRSIVLEDGIGYMPLLLFMFSIGCLIDAARYLSNRIEVNGNMLCCYRFLKKKREIDIKKITEIHIVKDKRGGEKYIFYSGKEKIFDFKIVGYMSGTDFFEQRMSYEKVNWKTEAK